MITVPDALTGAWMDAHTPSDAGMITLNNNSHNNNSSNNSSSSNNNNNSIQWKVITSDTLLQVISAKRFYYGTLQYGSRCTIYWHTVTLEIHSRFHGIKVFEDLQEPIQAYSGLFRHY